MKASTYIRLMLALVLVWWAHPSPVARAAHTEARLLLAADTATVGTTVLAGVELKMEPGWHTYWKNPGVAGQATEIKWQLPPGVTAGEIQWPLPHKIPPTDITTYGYESEVVLLVPLKLSADLAAGPLDLKAKVSWLECKDSCLPASAQVQTVLHIGNATNPTAEAPRLRAWQAKVPAITSSFSAQAWWDKPANGDTRSLNLQWPGSAQGAEFFPAASEDFEIQGATEWLPAPEGQIHLRKLVKKFSGEWPREISGVFAQINGAHETSIVIGDRPTSVAAPITPPAKNPEPLWRMLIYAFIGGLILNIMPCVLPVIALKILGFVSEAKSSPRHVRLLGVVYALGVLASFLALAGVVSAVKFAGHQAAWGMQFGNPIFLVCLITLITLVALNLFGLFEVTLAGGAMNLAGGLAAKNGAAGAFFNGVLATVLATPCTAPILGSALGFAFTQSALTLTVVFLFIGLGLASPYVLLSWNPAWLKFLPKPGAWMEKFKIAMGFPMLAAVMWLFSVATSTYGKKVLWLGIFLITLAAAAWIFGEFVQRGRSRKTPAVIAVLALLLGGYTFALEKELNWRHPAYAAPKTGSLQESADGIAWQPWSPEALRQARATGRPVLVDFTADWCLTCQVNKKTSLEIPAVREKLKALNIIALLADYTHTPDAITTELKRFNRAGVPLVLIYPKGAKAAPIILPEVLTPGSVLKALDEAAN